MTGKINWLVIPTMMLVIGNLDAQTDRRLNGTWVFNTEGTEIEITLNNGNFEQSYVNVSVDHKEFTRGTYIAMDGVLIFRPTHTMIIGSLATQMGLESAKWYTTNELKIAMINYLTKFVDSSDAIDEIIDTAVSPPPQNYSVVNSSLTITTMYGENVVYTKIN